TDHAPAQIAVRTNSAVHLGVVSSEPVTGFATGDVVLSGTAGATTATVSGSGTTYTVAVSGMTSDGTVVAPIPAGVATDAAANSKIGRTTGGEGGAVWGSAGDSPAKR